MGKKLALIPTLMWLRSYLMKYIKLLKLKVLIWPFNAVNILNRALVMERSAVTWEEEVNVVPQRHAGGAMAVTAYERFDDPVMVEFIKADAGIDIGDTFIGMHMKHVTVPVRLSIKRNWWGPCNSLSCST